MTGHGLILAAPASGSGKTTLTLGLLRALVRRGVAVRAAKSGPDYIDPGFHAAATGGSCLNLDAWAMTEAEIRARAAGPGLLVIEGAMGLFDGAPPAGRGATAELARILSLPVILVIDAGRMAQSVAPLALGFSRFDPAVRVAGVILNRVGSARHEAMLRRALTATGIACLGALPRRDDLALPSRHLGLVLAGERPDLTAFLDRAAEAVAGCVDLAAIRACARPLPAPGVWAPPPPPAQRIAVARDAAFAFAYPHWLSDWRRAGAEIAFFSPLADEPVPPQAGFVFLPGGYPELHAGRIAAAGRFLTSLRSAARHAEIYGECGGYMVLGEALIDAEGRTHAMAGLLALTTSFAARRLTLGYRRLRARTGPFPGRHRGHEFHYATTLSARGAPLFAAEDAEGAPLGEIGLSHGRVSGSFAHLIAPEP